MEKQRLKSRRYQFGTLEKIRLASGDTWYLRYRTAQGKRERFRVGPVSDYPSKSQARKASKHLLDRINAPQVEQQKTFHDLIERYKQEEMPTRPSTRNGYMSHLELHIGPMWGHRLIADVRAAAVRSWLRDLACSPKTRSHIHGTMRILFRYAMLWEWLPIAENPMSLFRIEGASKRTRQPHSLSPEEFAKVLALVPNEPHRTMFIAAICLGFRCSELFGMRWRDIDFEHGMIALSTGYVNGKVGPVKTVQSERPIPMAEELASIFLTWRRQTEFPAPSDWVFASPWRAGEFPYDPYGMQRKMLTRIGREAGLGFRLGWHTFRHTYRSWLDHTGAPVGVQKDLLRHADIRTTMNTYGQSLTSDMRSAHGKVVEMMKVARSA